VMELPAQHRTGGPSRGGVPSPLPRASHVFYHASVTPKRRGKPV